MYTPEISPKIVLFPEPFEPVIIVCSFLGIFKFKLFKIFSFELKYENETSLKLIANLFSLFV